MDPWLEHPALRPDVHNRLVAAIGDDLSPRVAPRYYVALERRTYHLEPDDLVFVGRPDLAVIRGRGGEAPAAAASSAAAVLEVSVPGVDEVEECYLEVRDVESGTLVTLLELLSPGNKLHRQGREDYLVKREEVFSTRTNLVEIDLLRDGRPMPVEGALRPADYRILVRRGHEGRRARLYVFSVRDPIPSVGIPLLPGDAEPQLRVGDVLHGVYARARFDLRLDYSKDPVPPLDEADRAWARERWNAAD